jgi:outer membrane protein OmpA-like peptidoglycan-associated protein
MGRWRITATLGVAVLFLVSCASPPRVVPESRSKAAGGELIVLLPKANGPIGGVVVRGANGTELLLNTAYAGAVISAQGSVLPVGFDGPRAQDEFGPVLVTLPARPVTHLLYFLEGKDEMTPGSEKTIREIFSDIAERPDPEILVIGHTDKVGSVRFNDQLSLQRAQIVKKILVRRGFPAASIQVSGRGSREPLIDTPGKVAEQKNRRVEISVR